MMECQRREMLKLEMWFIVEFLIKVFHLSAV